MLSEMIQRESALFLRKYLAFRTSVSSMPPW